MRLRVSFLFAALVLNFVQARPPPIARQQHEQLPGASKRELGGLLGGLEETTTEALHHTEPVPASTHIIEHTTTNTAPPRPTTEASTVTHSSERTPPLSTTGTPPPTIAPPASGTAKTSEPSPTSSNHEPSATPTPGPEGEHKSSPQSTGPDWRVIGVAVIAVSVIGTAILAVVFFDQWWRFVGDACGGRRRKRRGVEEMVPDWEKGSWEYRPDDGDGVFGSSAETEKVRGLGDAEQMTDGRGRKGRSSVVLAATQHLEVPPRPLLRTASNASRYDQHGGAYAPRDPNYLSPSNPVYDLGSPAYNHYGRPVSGGSRIPHSAFVQDDAHLYEQYPSPLQGENRVHRSNTTHSSRTEDPYDGLVPGY